MSDTITRIFDENGVIKQMKPDYVPRPSQISAANLIRDSLDNGIHSIIEGPCGFGKTFAYLIPLVDYILENNFEKKAVITTNGISLQEQLFYKDLPLIQKIFRNLNGSEFKFSLIKGKQNFLCSRKMKDLVADNAAGQINDKDLKKIINWYFETKTGDFSELDFIPNYEVLKEVSCIKEGECLGRKCDNYDNCYYQRCKARAQGADIIITNYHLLFSDIETGNKILPNYDILVCDEAHEMADIFREFQSSKVSPNIIKSIRNDIVEIRNKFPFERDFIDNLNLKGFVSECEKYFYLVYGKHLNTRFADLKIIEDSLELPDHSDFLAIAKNIHGNIFGESESLSRIVQMSENFDSESNDTVICYNKILSVLRKLDNIIDIMQNFRVHSSNPDVVYWIEKEGDDSSSLNIKPVKVGEFMAEVLFEREDKTCILTSATLSVANKFDFIKSELGLDTCKPNEFVGESPFNLTDQQLWYLPEDAIEGNNPEFDKQLNEQILGTINACNGGVLSLFTSVRNLNAVYDYLKWEAPPTINILKQGMKPKIQLLEDFKDDVNSVLLATRSFFTGVDIPGESLRCVIIDKLPFPSPGDPVMKKLQKEPNSFYKYFIPMMIITLKQAVGRGVRSIDDKCVICILDNRMATASYKTRINSSFNYTKTGTRNLYDVRKFCGIEESTSWEDSDDIPF